MIDRSISGDKLRSMNSEEVIALQEELNQQKSIIQNYRKEHGKLEVFFNRVLDSITPVKPLARIYEPVKTKSETPVSAVLHLTDWHVGAMQEGYEVEEFNEFNFDVCKKRVRYCTKRAIDWITLHRNAYPLDDLHLLVTGDLISGDIHDELKITNEFPTPVQVWEAAKLLAEQVTVYAPHFKNVIVEFISEDNHARLTKKPQMKEAGRNSFNYLVGLMAQQILDKHDNVDFRIHAMYEKVVGVSSRRYLISHGHGVRGWMGIPWYSIERKVSKEAKARLHEIMLESERAKEIGFHKYVFGHYHTPFDSANYSCGGSVQGTDAYDHQSGRHGDPCQSAWMVHPKYGEFDRTNFNLKFV